VDDSSHCDETGAVILKIELTDDFDIARRHLPIDVLTIGITTELHAIP
jgi:hypothetical protein